MSRTMLEDCESDEPLEDAPPLWKKQNTRMDVKDADINADINLLAMTDLSQCTKDPGDVYPRCSMARYNPQRPWLTSLLVGAV